MVKRGKNPLNKRFLRELKGELGKYLVIFILLTGTIGFVSGFLVADTSMLKAYNESFEVYRIEDGNFRTAQRLNKARRKAVEALGVTLYDLFYADCALTNGSTLRVFETRTQVDLACLMAGAMPTAAGEAAIDRMYADNNGITVGDTLTDGAGRQYTVTGLVALSDYSSLFSSNSDSMFDAVKFGVAVVAPGTFAAFGDAELHWRYAWRYDTPPAAEEEARDRAETFLKALDREVPLEEFTPRAENQAICFTGEDMGGDKAMVTVLLYILIAIMAFVFSLITASTIAKEAGVIGTLRASGYTRGELLRHYMAMPMLVTLLGAVVGNLLGYTFFEDLCAGLYYGSYSLPTYVTVWSAEAFVLTTLVPAGIMAAVNAWLLARKLRLSPLKFLRHDLSSGRQRRALLLPPLRFFSRFRLRVILQNLGSYAVLFLGVIFANLLLMFGMAMPMLLETFQENIETNLLCRCQYLLSAPVSMQNDDRKLESLVTQLTFARAVETENPDAEKFSVYSLQTLPGAAKTEEVLLYGVKEQSRYIPLEVTDGAVMISTAYAEKYRLAPGDTFTLKERYEETAYTFTVGGIYDYDAALAVFMPQEQLNRTFDLGSDYFCGYLSDSEITDIDARYIGSVVDVDALTKLTRQLQVSMGEMADILNIFALVIFAVLIYLLSKTIIEKNAQAVSMVKILGYSAGEISRLYILSTSIVVAVSLAASLPLVRTLLQEVLRIMQTVEMTGWIPYDLNFPLLYAKMLAAGLLCYAVVAALEYRRIRRVPMTDALKNME